MGNLAGRDANNAMKASRDAEIFEMRIKGMSYQAIADETGLSVGGVWTIVKRRIKERVAESADEYIAQEEARLDALQNAAWPAAMKGDIQSIQACLAVSANRRKMLGIDAKQALDVTLLEGAMTPAKAAELMRQTFGAVTPTNDEAGDTAREEVPGDPTEGTSEG